MSIVAESPKVPMSRSPQSVAPAGAASGTVDVAPVLDDAPQRPHTSTKTGVVQQPKDAADKSPEGKKTPATTTTAKKPPNSAAKDVDSSAVAADHVKDAAEDDLLGDWGDDNLPRELTDFESLDDDSTKDSLAAHPRFVEDEVAILKRVVKTLVDGERDAKRDDDAVLRHNCCGVAREKNSQNQENTTEVVDRDVKKAPAITLTIPTPFESL